MARDPSDTRDPDEPPVDGDPVGVLFDLDGVITDTSELHYRSWQRIAADLGLAFDRAANEHLRGLGRQESLAVLLGSRMSEFDDAQQAEILTRKNQDYLDLVARLGPADVFDGIAGLMRGLRSSGARLAVASSSRNARRVIDRLGVANLLDTVVDGNDAPLSKPDPQVFLFAAERLGVPAGRCVVIEDAASGVDAALAARMQVVGVGPAERVGRATVRVARPEDLRAGFILGLLGRSRFSDG
jgi:kojibiose phosphorylase